ncbi:hypothetical protein PVAP13_2KG119432 [Panicum virgatum]|uniref:Uncharacterized protein n=1 Tax=Panicum virgatum TaxID=38727 RepID=A0A8T0W4A0_PANVG|nr:hypothetical protein PVAP13_2KG119432 [Panicum virgatum]
MALAAVIKTVLKIQRMKEMCILIVPCSGWRKVSGCPNGMENAARRVVRNVIKKLIPQIFYEGRIQSVIIYYNRVLGKKIKRAQACQIDLTVEEYVQAIPWWAQKAPEAWELAAELKWCNEAWKVKSREAKARRRKMGGASHRQGSCSHTHWKKKVEKVKQRPVSDVEAYTSGRMGNQEGTYCNPRVAANNLRFNI